MRFQETALAGVRLVEPGWIRDERGYFARTWCRDEFRKAGLDFAPEQESTSFNLAAGTLRGMHFQRPPGEEQKLVRCTRGAVYDVALDLRPGSATRCRWFGVELSAANGLALFIPRGVAHGFVTLEPSAELLYLIDVPFAPQLAAGVRWDDPAFGIQWPRAPAVMSEKDRAWAAFET